MRLIVLISLFCAFGLSTQFRANKQNWGRDGYKIRRLSGTDPITVVVNGAPTPAPATQKPPVVAAPHKKKKICFVEEDEFFGYEHGKHHHHHPHHPHRPPHHLPPFPAPLPLPAPLPSPPPQPPKPFDPLEDALNQLFKTPDTKVKLFDILDAVPEFVKNTVLAALPVKVLEKNPVVSIETWRKLWHEAKGKEERKHHHHHHHHRERDEEFEVRPPFVPGLPPFLPVPPPFVPLPAPAPVVPVPAPFLPAPAPFLPIPPPPFGHRHHSHHAHHVPRQDSVPPFVPGIPPFPAPHSASNGY